MKSTDSDVGIAVQNLSISDGIAWLARRASSMRARASPSIATSGAIAVYSGGVPASWAARPSSTRDATTEAVWARGRSACRAAMSSRDCPGLVSIPR